MAHHSKFVAHIRKSDGAEQTVKEHLTGVAELASKWAELVGFEQTARITALLHDMGKFSEAFQMHIYMHIYIRYENYSIYCRNML